MSRLPLIAAAAITVGLLGYFALPALSPQPGISLNSVQAQDAEVDTSMVQEMSIGAQDAPVTVIEYASFTCPHCASFHSSVLPQLKSDYVDSGKVRFVYREVYFDRYGLWAGMVARCGGGERYFGIIDMIYDQQRSWTQGDPATIAGNLRKIGLTAGLEAETVDACLQDADKAQAMYALYQQNADADDIKSTPSFVIDGETYSNMSYADFAELLDGKLAN
jgi:protein-disulfide isomerase